MCFHFSDKKRQHINNIDPHPFPGRSRKVVMFMMICSRPIVRRVQKARPRLNPPYSCIGDVRRHCALFSRRRGVPTSQAPFALSFPTDDDDDDDDDDGSVFGWRWVALHYFPALRAGTLYAPSGECCDSLPPQTSKHFWVSNLHTRHLLKMWFPRALLAISPTSQ